MTTGAELTGRDLRRKVIEVSLRAGVGHIASALSICDIVAVLFRRCLRGVGTSEADRSRFILSKGHAALALYSALWRIGLLSKETLDTYCKDGSILGVHPERGIPGVDVTTGSLGLGLSVGAGLAFSARLRGRNTRVWVLLSDAELNEGSVWEAAMFAAQHRLSGLTAVIDANGMQAMGRTRDILDLEPLVDRWRGFGWDAVEVDGHDEPALERALAPTGEGGRPRVVVARTVNGKGVSFMEGKLDWHYYPVNEEQARRALLEIGGTE